MLLFLMQWEPAVPEGRDDFSAGGSWHWLAQARSCQEADGGRELPKLRCQSSQHNARKEVVRGESTSRRRGTKSNPPPFKIVTLWYHERCMVSGHYLTSDSWYSCNGIPYLDLFDSDGARYFRWQFDIQNASSVMWKKNSLFTAVTEQ